jgi:hypothetical protein
MRGAAVDDQNSPHQAIAHRTFADRTFTHRISAHRAFADRTFTHRMAAHRASLPKAAGSFTPVPPQ